MVIIHRAMTAQQITALRSATNWANSQGKDHRYAHWYITSTSMEWGKFVPHQSAYRKWLLASADYPVFDQPGAQLNQVGGLCPHCDKWGFFPWTGRRKRQRVRDLKGRPCPGSRSEGTATRAPNPKGRMVRIGDNDGIYNRWRERHRWEGQYRKYCTYCAEQCTATGHRCACCDVLFGLGEITLGKEVQRRVE